MILYGHHRILFVDTNISEMTVEVEIALKGGQCGFLYKVFKYVYEFAAFVICFINVQVLITRNIFESLATLSI